MTHGDYLAFIDDGGYRRPELWLALGWEAVAPAVGRRRCTGNGATAGWSRSRCAAWREIDPALPVII